MWPTSVFVAENDQAMRRNTTNKRGMGELTTDELSSFSGSAAAQFMRATGPNAVMISAFMKFVTCIIGLRWWETLAANYSAIRSSKSNSSSSRTS
jgi:hypothetical protein